MRGVRSGVQGEDANVSDVSYCTSGCAAMPTCDVCHLIKAPRGRDVGVAAANGYCGYDCPGYLQAPWSGHLWPEEWREGQARRDGEDAR